MMLAMKVALRQALLSRYGLSGKQIFDEGWNELLHDQAQFPEIEDVLPTGTSHWAISRQLARVLARIVVNQRPLKVLEFGAGSSSLILARALSLIGGGQLTSVEEMPAWCAEQWAQVEAITCVNAQLVEATPRFKIAREGAYFSFDSVAQVIANRGPYDFLLVDGPQWFFGREGALHTAYPHLSPDAVIVLDDARRTPEQLTLYRWLQIYPGLQLVILDPGFGKSGVAVLLHMEISRDEDHLLCS